MKSNSAPSLGKQLEETLEKEGGVHAGSGRPKEEATSQGKAEGKCASQQARVLRKFTDSCLANHLLKLLYVVSDLFIKDSFSYFLFPTGLLVHSYIPVTAGVHMHLMIIVTAVA